MRALAFSGLFAIGWVGCASPAATVLRDLTPRAVARLSHTPEVYGGPFR